MYIPIFSKIPYVDRANILQKNEFLDLCYIVGRSRILPRNRYARVIFKNLQNLIIMKIYKLLLLLFQVRGKVPILLYYYKLT